MAKVNKTNDKDKGYRKIIKASKDLKGSLVTIGVHSEEGQEVYPGSGATVAEVAFWNEYGTVTAPERSFIRSTIDENRSELELLTSKLLKAVIDRKMTTEVALNKLGFKIQTLIQKKILTLNDPPNAESTVARKGFNNPLVDSRRLWRSVAYEVLLGGGKMRDIA